VGRATVTGMTNTDDILARLFPSTDYDEDDWYHDYDDEVPLSPLPLGAGQTASLRQAIEVGLLAQGCDNTLRRAQAWARREKVRWAWLRNELEERGGYCDCEVVLNVVTPYDDA
jgi:hypothetical protein